MNAEDLRYHIHFHETKVQQESEGTHWTTTKKKNLNCKWHSLNTPAGTSAESVSCCTLISRGWRWPIPAKWGYTLVYCLCLFSGWELPGISIAPSRALSLHDQHLNLSSDHLGRESKSSPHSGAYSSCEPGTPVMWPDSGFWVMRPPGGPGNSKPVQIPNTNCHVLQTCRHTCDRLQLSLPHLLSWSASVNQAVRKVTVSFQTPVTMWPSNHTHC